MMHLGNGDMENQQNHTHCHYSVSAVASVRQEKYSRRLQRMFTVRPTHPLRAAVSQRIRTKWHHLMYGSKNNSHITYE